MTHVGIRAKTQLYRSAMFGIALGIGALVWPGAEAAASERPEQFCPGLLKEFIRDNGLRPSRKTYDKAYNLCLDWEIAAAEKQLLKSPRINVRDHRNKRPRVRDHRTKTEPQVIVRDHRRKKPRVRAHSPCLVSLKSPSNYALLSQRSIGDEKVLSSWRFSWSGCKRATHYHLYAIGPTALNPIIDVETIRGTSYSYRSEHYGSTMMEGWTWKVRAKVDNRWGPWSEVRTFDISEVLEQ